MKNFPLIHVGFPKAASTWLQSQLFSEEKFGFYPLNRHMISEVFGLTHPLSFDPMVAWDRFRPDIKVAMEKNLTPVISQEFLSGNAYLNGGVDGKFYADALRATFPKSRILILIREQTSFLLSFYKMDVSQFGGFYALKEFLHPTWHFLRRSQFHPRFAKYDRLIRYYQKIFGVEAVKVIPYEDLVSNPIRVAQSIQAFTNQRCAAHFDQKQKDRVNVSRSASMVHIQRYVNRIFTSRPENSIRVANSLAVFVNRRLLSKADQVLFQRNRARGDAHLHSKIESCLFDYYRESNRQTEKLTGLDLGKRQYQV